MHRKILTLIVAACVLGLAGCQKKSLNQVSLEAAKHLAEYKELVSAFSEIQNLKSAGDNVNGYWKTRGGSWSKDADATSSISFDELCRAQSLKAEDVKSLQKKLDASGVMQICRKGSEIYLLIARNGFAHPGGTTFYVVWSNKSPNELYGESKKMVGESNWWVMEVR